MAENSQMKAGEWVISIEFFSLRETLSFVIKEK